MANNRTCPTCNTPLPASTPEDLCPCCMLRAGLETGAEIENATGETEDRRRFTPPSTAEMASHFPNLEITDLIGRGGMGAVYRARQPQLDRVVALKILPPGSDVSGNFAERFMREARALAQLNHPNIVVLYEFGRTNPSEGSPLFYFLMEFVDGLNLRQLLDAGKLAPEEALSIVPQICEALQFAHDRGVVHRDIKPENILMGRDGRVKIADFGVAKIMEDSRSNEPPPAPDANPRKKSSTLAVGTPLYMAPEQKDRPLDVDHRADIYSLGVVLYQMLTGEAPGDEIGLPARRLNIDVKLDEIVLRAMEATPERRFQSAKEFRTEIETYTSEHQTPAAKVAEFPKSATRVAFERLIDSRIGRIAAILSMLAIVGSAVFVSLRFSWDTAEQSANASEAGEVPVSEETATPTESTAPASEPVSPPLVAEPQTEPPAPTTASAPEIPLTEPATPASPLPEQVVVMSSSNADESGLLFFDMETGRSFAAPTTLNIQLRDEHFFIERTDEFIDWIERKDVDLAILFRNSDWARLNIDMQEEHASQPTAWPTLAPENALEIFERKDAKGLVSGRFPASSWGNGYRDGASSGIAFRTRTQSTGVFQLEAFENTINKGVIVRLRFAKRHPKTQPEIASTTPDPQPAQEATKPTFTSASLIARLESARSIGSNGERDTALAAVARDAASSGDAAVTVRAVDSIRSSYLRDVTAQETVGTISKIGNHAQAVELAKKIGGSNARDAALATIARDAAEAEEWLICLKAIDRIKSSDARNQAATKSAHALASRGRHIEALEVARKVSSASARDALLKELSN